MKTNKIVRELTPELADKIWKSIQKRIYDQKVSKDAVLHHLKQLKAQMGKLKAKNTAHKFTIDAINSCMEAVDKKIEKIKNQ